MTADQSKYEQDLECLLDYPEDRAGLRAAQGRVLRDPGLRAEYESLQRVGVALAELGELLHQGAGTIQIREDVQDSIAHHALEELHVANASPYRDLEHALGTLKDAFDVTAGKVSLVDDVMAAVGASRQADAEVERPFAEVASRLNGVGDALRANTPDVELVEPVMDELHRRAPVIPNMVPMRARPAVAKAFPVPANRPKWSRLAGWAAAIAVCAGAAWLYHLAGTHDGAPRIAQGGAAAPTPGVPDGNPEDVGFKLSRVPDAPGADGLPGVDTPPENPPAVQPDENGKAPLTLQEVINARRRELVRNSEQFAALASLTPEEAIQLLKDMDLSLEAIIGATQFLPVDDAIAVLRAAIAQHPDDPNLRYALAQNLEGNPDLADERLQQLTQMASADKTNGLPHYMMAADYFARGQADLGMDELSKGSSYAESSAYTLEGARQREAALVASGLSTDVARFLALNTSGDQEYSDITTLRSELMDYAAHYEDLEDYDTAQQIYNAVNQLGVQLAAGADMAVEQQYGYETQEQALLAIQGIAEILQQPEAIALLGDALGRLATGIVEVTQHIAVRQELVDTAGLSNQADAAALMEYLMANGDLQLESIPHH